MAYPYINLGDISGMVPGRLLMEAFDEDKDGAADVHVVNRLLDEASWEVDGKVGYKYAKPFRTPFPFIVHQAAQFFAIRAIYTKCGKANENAFKRQADDYDAILARVAAGTLPLEPNVQREKPSAAPAPRKSNV